VRDQKADRTTDLGTADHPQTWIFRQPIGRRAYSRTTPRGESSGFCFEGGL